MAGEPFTAEKGKDCVILNDNTEGVYHELTNAQSVTLAHALNDAAGHTADMAEFERLFDEYVDCYEHRKTILAYVRALMPQADMVAIPRELCEEMVRQEVVVKPGQSGHNRMRSCRADVLSAVREALKGAAK